MPDHPTPEMLKKMRADVATKSPSPPGPMPPPPTKGRSRIVTVEDAGDEDDEHPSRDFAPGGDADYFAEEDEEGRFFGGGLTREQKEILNIFEDASGEGVGDDVSRSPSAVRRLMVVLKADCLLVLSRRLFQ